MDLENYLTRLITSRLSKITLSDFQFESPEEGHLSLEAVADLSDFVITTESKICVPPIPFTVIR